MSLLVPPVPFSVRGGYKRCTDELTCMGMLVFFCFLFFFWFLLFSFLHYKVFRKRRHLLNCTALCRDRFHR